MKKALLILLAIAISATLIAQVKTDKQLFLEADSSFTIYQDSVTNGGYTDYLNMDVSFNFPAPVYKKGFIVRVCERYIERRKIKSIKK